MKEIFLCHAEFIIFPFCEQEAEYYGYDEEFFSLDLINPVQAEYAINKWLIPEVGSWTEIGRELRREAARVCISQGIAFGDIWFPGISDRWKLTGDLQEFSINVTRFQRAVFEAIFLEQYEALPLELFVLRVDDGFEQFPDFPHHWTEAMYSDWPAGFKVGAR